MIMLSPKFSPVRESSIAVMATVPPIGRKLENVPKVTPKFVVCVKVKSVKSVFPVLVIVRVEFPCP